MAFADAVWAAFAVLLLDGMDSFRAAWLTSVHASTVPGCAERAVDAAKALGISEVVVHVVEDATARSAKTMARKRQRRAARAKRDEEARRAAPADLEGGQVDGAAAQEEGEAKRRRLRHKQMPPLAYPRGGEADAHARSRPSRSAGSQSPLEASGLCRGTQRPKRSKREQPAVPAPAAKP